jgi:hypothetical protein
LLDVEIGSAEKAVSFAQGANFVSAESAALQAHLVDAADFRRIAVGDHKWRNVLNDLGAASEDGMPSDAAKLMTPLNPPITA